VYKKHRNNDTQINKMKRQIFYKIQRKQNIFDRHRHKASGQAV
jgi:hypothetical protein